MIGVLLFSFLTPLAVMIAVGGLDRLEREPLKLVFGAFGLGAAMVIPVVLVELGLQYIFNWTLYSVPTVHAVVNVIFAVALVEEYGRRAVLRFFLWKHPAFNCRFDAVVYCVAASLGFAALENLGYVMMGGINLVRLIPVHTLGGLSCGAVLGLAKQAQVNGNKRAYHRLLVTSILPGLVLHSLWDLSCDETVGNSVMTVVLMLVIIVLTVVAIIGLFKLQKRDRPFIEYSPVMADGPLPAGGPLPADGPDGLTANTPDGLTAETNPPHRTTLTMPVPPVRCPAAMHPVTGQPLYRDPRNGQLYCLSQTGKPLYKDPATGQPFGKTI